MKVEPAKRMVLVLFAITLVAAAVALITKSGERTAKDERTPAEKAVDAFRTASLAGDERSAEEAYDALKRLGPSAIPPAVELLGEHDDGLRAHGAELFAELVEAIREGGASASAAPEVIGSVPLLVARLDDPNDRVRSEAASALGWIGPDATGALPALEKRLSDASQTVRDKAEMALARIRTGALEPGPR